MDDMPVADYLELAKDPHFGDRERILYVLISIAEALQNVHI